MGKISSSLIVSFVSTRAPLHRLARRAEIGLLLVRYHGGAVRGLHVVRTRPGSEPSPLRNPGRRGRAGRGPRCRDRLDQIRHGLQGTVSLPAGYARLVSVGVVGSPATHNSVVQRLCPDVRRDNTAWPGYKTQLALGACAATAAAAWRCSTYERTRCWFFVCLVSRNASERTGRTRPA